MLRHVTLLTILLLATACASAPQDAAVVTAGDNARTFEGLIRFGTGFFGGPKSIGEGRMEVGPEGLLWHHDRDDGRNLALRPEVISRVWLTCASRASENLCLDLGVETLTGGEYHFRDRNWEGGANTMILDAYEHLRATYSQVRFDRRAVEDFR